jgi:hypothetical protein
MVKFRNDAERAPVAAKRVRVYVVGGTTGQARAVAHAFPVIEWNAGESQWSHVMRVAREVRKAVAAGGTHLLVPRDQADWLGANALLIEYFVARHEIVEASAETGVLFALTASGE